MTSTARHTLSEHASPRLERELDEVMTCSRSFGLSGLGPAPLVTVRLPPTARSRSFTFHSESRTRAPCDTQPTIDATDDGLGPSTVSEPLAMARRAKGSPRQSSAARARRFDGASAGS